MKARRRYPGLSSGESEAEEVPDDKSLSDTNERRTRRKRSVPVDDDSDEDAIRTHRTRGRSVNYNEDALLAAIDDEIGHNSDESAEDEGGSSRKRRRTRSRKLDDEEFDEKVASNSDDEFDEDEVLSSDDSLRPRRRRQPGFIVKDDEDVDEDEEFDLKKEKRRRNGRLARRTRGRPRKEEVEEFDDESEEDESLTLADELKALQDDSPLNSPVQRNLRERKNVNYQLPPPILQPDTGRVDLMESPRRGRAGGRFGGIGGSVAPSTQIRRLFPTVGPFGGGDVHALFQNGGVPDTLTAIGNVESSDSEDDNELFKPTDPNKLNIVTVDSNVPGKKKNTLADTDPLGIDTNIDFSVVGGLDNYINQLKEMITLPLLYPEIYSRFHITPPRGVLFHGPPGTGKTLMARALAASCSSQQRKVTFFMRKGADCLSKWVGEAERHLRLLFEEAKQQQPSIIFFDEIDGLAPVRSSKQEQIHASIVSTLLALMDGMDNRGQVIVIGATNRPDSIDPALRRPGRFDREFYFPLPDDKAREEILKIHMRKWDHQLDPGFVHELARLTKGYGGADLKALCTESALNAIQRAYPQIYQSNDKLKININKVKVIASDFTRTLDKIVPSSARATSLSSSPLPEAIAPLLQAQLDTIVQRTRQVIPSEKPVTLLEESQYVDLTSFEPDGGFQHQQLLSKLNQLRVFKPRLLITGHKGDGQEYIANAVLHSFEGFNVQTLDFAKLYTDSSISPENVVIQLFQELKRHKPSVLYVPYILSFLDDITSSLRSTISGLVRTLDPNDRILVIGMVEEQDLLDDNYYQELDAIFGFTQLDSVELHKPSEEQRKRFFENVWTCFQLTPIEYNEIGSRPKRKLKELPKIEIVEETKEPVDEPRKEVEIARADMRLKNTLKVKLSGLMELFKARYKRFKKPIIEDSYLVHLFEPEPDPEAPYQRQDDRILEVATGKLYYNIDLDVIEERLWNGYYSEPRQFLGDIEMILKDANMSGERDRILKANEMYANAQVGIEEMEIAFPQLAADWKAARQREKRREAEYLRQLKEKEIAEAEVAAEGQNDAVVVDVQQQAQLMNGGDDHPVPPEPESVSVEPILPAEQPIKEELQKEVQEEQNEDPAPESSDEEYERPEPQTLVYSPVDLVRVQELLLRRSASMTVDQLVRQNSKMIELIWDERHNLDKTELLRRLEATLA
ncbi:hypothetical protein OGAPHI_003025 [Ogataea philodendri]|uniref:Bromo domain-containing protein n=1 Tax=Ogataea philodendri TaxID=1378263 RepID=A0A9P8P931_9ASCO|nr:uncharacterized protein OGAPHI_003025 [Ogataea philodendri]KAH3667376.1 hypothetical protein OGAPHI_003025 [Ogataea philodendri]